MPVIASDRLTWHALSAFGAVVALFGVVGMALGVARGPGETLEAALAPPAQAELNVPAARRCPHCGWIESKREILPGVYEYRLRMADGTSRTFQETLPTRWRVRERLTVIDGTGPQH